MNSNEFRSRRATIDDLPALRGLWQTALLPAHELEKHLTDFQVVEGLDGRLIGALGFRTLGEEAWIHHETFTHPETEKLVHADLWERLKRTALNQGAHRAWTQSSSEFWTQDGFKPTTPDLVEKLPSAFEGSPGVWRVCALRDEATERRIHQRVSLLKATSTEEQERLARQTRWIKTAAWIALGMVIAVMLYLTLRVFFNLPAVR